MRRIVWMALVLVGCVRRDSSYMLHVEIAGDGTGTVNGCTTSCDQPVAPGSTVDVIARTTDSFGGWSGCSSDTYDVERCRVDVTSSDVTVVATFNKDAHEIGALSPDVPTTHGAFAPNGDLVVAGVDGSNRTVLSRITQQGATVWSTPISIGKPGPVRVGTDIFVLGTTGLAEVSPAGVVAWTVALATLADVAILPSGDVAVMDFGRVVEVRSRLDGNVVWSQQVSSAGPIAVDSLGDVADYTCSSIVRFDSSGQALASWPLPAASCPITIMFSQAASMVFDSQDALYVYVAGGSAASGTVTRFDPTGTATSFSAPGLVATASMGGWSLAIATGANDHVVTAIADFPNVALTPPSGVMAASFAPTGAPDWALEKKSDGELVPFNTFELFDGVILSDLACTSSGLCALIGQHDADQTLSSWIELLQQ